MQVMLRLFLLLVGVASSVVSARVAFYNYDPKCRARYCSRRNGYCSADCCECLCNHNRYYDSDFDYCELIPATDGPPTLPSTTLLTTIKVTTIQHITNAPLTKPEATTPTAGGQVITQPSAMNETAIPASKKSGAKNAGPIAGAVVGVITVLVVLLVVAIFCYRKKTRRKSDKTVAHRANGLPSKGKHSHRDTPDEESGCGPIYAYADLSPNIGMAGRTVSSSSKAPILPKASPDLRLPNQESYDYATDTNSYRPPVAPRPVSCSELHNKKLSSSPPITKQSHPLTIARSSNLASEIGSSPPSRRAAPAPPCDGANEPTPIYHILDDQEKTNPYSMLDENDKEPISDELYERPIVDSGQNEEVEDPYRELTYAHSPGVYEALGPLEDQHEGRI